MTDYSKNTVAQIREIFKERGIAATGLTKKAQLIARLEEHDAELATNEAAPAEEEASAQDDGTNAANDASEGVKALDDADGDSAPAAKVSNEAHMEPTAGASTAQAEVLPAADVEEPIKPSQAEDATGPDGQPSESAAVNDAAREEIEAAADAEVADASVGDKPLITGDSDVKRDVPAFDEVAKTAEIASKEAYAAGQPPDLEPISGEQTATPTTSLDTNAAPPSPSSDTRKRKRRSPTPSLDETAIANKKARQSESDGPAPAVILKEDKEADTKMAGTGSAEDVAVEDDIPAVIEQVAADESKAGEVQQQVADAAAGVPATIAESVATAPDGNRISTAALEVAPATHDPTQPTGSSADSPFAPTKLSSGRDARYKELLSPTGEQVPAIQSNLDGHFDSQDDERMVAPATHPATTALYIRELMRPLKDAALKSHLASSARPPTERHTTTSTDDEVVPTFHLDTIKTHCFATFTSVSAASRARNALHDRVWPPEGNRKPLWVDFIPEERVHDWIEREQSSGGGKASTAKRWEVIYDLSADGNVGAELREAGPGSVSQPPRHTMPSNVPTGPASTSTTARAPSSTPAVASRPDASTTANPEQTKIDNTTTNTPSFATLDSLFKSTTAKPKLYYQPVSESLAAKRLEELDARTTRRPGVPKGGTGFPDATRFTFEEGEKPLLVDNGPEFGLRGGAGRGGRGGRGGYRGRGGGGFEGRGGFQDRGGYGGHGGRRD